jgi:hypothetical protein
VTTHPARPRAFSGPFGCLLAVVLWILALGMVWLELQLLMLHSLRPFPID